MKFAVAFLLVNLCASFSWSMGYRATHSHLIALPAFLSDRGLVHGQCDCHDLVHEGHYCGSHALTHALTVEEKFRTRPTKEFSASFQVKAAFAQLGFNTYESRISSQHFDTVAKRLGLDYLYLSFSPNGQIKNIFHADDDLWAPIRAINELENMRAQFQKAVPGQVIIKHIFAYIPPKKPTDRAGHVVHFAAVFDGQKLILTLLDNLNETVVRDSSIHRYADFLITFFIGAHKRATKPAAPQKPTANPAPTKPAAPKDEPAKPSAAKAPPKAEEPVRRSSPYSYTYSRPADNKPEKEDEVLAPQEEALSGPALTDAISLMYRLLMFNTPEKSEHYITKFYDYVTADQHLSFLEFLFDMWLGRATLDAVENNRGIKEINSVLPALKAFYASYPHDTLKEMVIKTYEAMIQVTNECAASDKTKYLQLDKIITKFKETSRAGFFRFDSLSKASQIFECAQNLRTDYRVKAGIPAPESP